MLDPASLSPISTLTPTLTLTITPTLTLTLTEGAEPPPGPLPSASYLAHSYAVHQHLYVNGKRGAEKWHLPGMLRRANRW
jgi:hypothetical protein